MTTTKHEIEFAIFDHPEHRTTVAQVYLGERIARCQCGLHWSYNNDRTLEYMRSVWESHLKYFNRPKMETL